VIWSGNGRELFFQNLDNRTMVTDYTATGDSFVPRKPHLGQVSKLHGIDGVLNYDLAPDGKRFAVFLNLNAAAEEKGEVHIAFRLNFFEELRSARSGVEQIAFHGSGLLSRDLVMWPGNARAG
jgi:hypothetical protein